jgi:hypothetical protein
LSSKKKLSQGKIELLVGGFNPKRPGIIGRLVSNSDGKKQKYLDHLPNQQPGRF